MMKAILFAEVSRAYETWETTCVAHGIYGVAQYDASLYGPCERAMERLVAWISRHRLPY